jgi:hypothetical protein
VVDLLVGLAACFAVCEGLRAVLGDAGGTLIRGRDGRGLSFAGAGTGFGST